MASNSLARTAYTSDDGDCYLLEHESGLWSRLVIARLGLSRTLSCPYG
jgi:hypothetical protein